MNCFDDGYEEMQDLAQFQCEMSPTPEKIVQLSQHQLRLLSELQVEISVEIGTLELSLEEVIDITRGKIFAFRYDETRPLALKIGEECIAFAQFVKDGEQLALQIISTDEEKVSELSAPESVGGR